MALGREELIRMIVRMEDETQKAANSVAGNLRNMSGAAGQAAGPLQRIAEIAGGIVTAQIFMRLARGVANLARAAVDAVGDYEALSMQIATLLAREQMALDPTLSMAEALEEGAEGAQNMLGWVTELALLSPFSEEDVGYIVRIGMSYQMSSEMAQTMAQALADLGAATGLPKEQMRLLGLALGQVESKGKLTGEEMRQLTNAGIGVDMVAQAMGISVNDVAEAMSAGEIAADQLLPGLFAIIESDFGGSAERMALSWNGLRSTLGDIGRVTLRTVLGPALTEIKPLIVDFLTRLQDPAVQEQLAALGQKIGVVVAGALDVLSNAITFVIQHWEEFRAIIVAVTAVLGGLAVLSLVAMLVGALASPIALVIAGVAALALAWSQNWGGIQEKTEAVVSWIQEFIRTTWTNIATDTDGIWAGIRTAIETVTGGIRDTIQTAIETAQQWWQENHEAIESAANTIWGAIQQFIGVTLGGIQGVIETVVGGITSFWEENHELIQTTTETVLTAVSSFVSGILTGIAAFWDEHGAAILAVVSNTWSTIEETISIAINLVSGVIRTVMQIINGDWDGAWETIRGVAETVWGSIETIVGNTIGSIEATLGVWAGVLTGIWESIETTTGDVWGRIKDAILTPVEEAKQAVSDIIGAIQGFIDGITIPHIPTPHISVWTTPGPLGIPVPHVDVQWYARGVDAIFDQPTIIGVGEAGAERVTVTPLTGPRAGQPSGGGGGPTYILNYTAIREEPGREDAEEAMRRMEWYARMRYA